MNFKLYTLLSFLLLGFGSSMAQTVIDIKDEDLEGETYNWTNDNIYMLDGLVFLESGGTLNIEEGTVIKSKGFPTTGDNTTALIITRDAQIFAEGTADQPIIFTAEVDDTNDPGDLDATLDKGLWGGLIVLGNATIARPGGEDGIEGIDADEVRAKYGGSDDTQSSGVISYVSIRHGGAALSEGNEINGLSLGGVGSGTQLDHIEILSNFDDGIEFFGGTVDLKYATVAFCGDDGYDYDYGWQGRGQFWFYLADDEGSIGRGGEHDGANPDLEEPFSQPTIFNATYIGAGSGSTGLDGDENDRALEFRDRAGGFYHNSVFTAFPGGAIRIEDLEGDDMDTYANFENGDLVLRENIFSDFANGTNLESLVDGENGAAIATAMADNGNQAIEDLLLGGISRDPNSGLDPRPNFGSAARADGDNPPAGGFWTDADYKGAFDPTTDLWLNGWTALDEYGYLGDLVNNAAAGCENNITIRDEDLETGQTYNWTSDNCYLIDGLVYLEEGGTLNIEAGTVIRAASFPTTGDNTSALIITRDAQIFAQGTETQPIIFTAQVDDPSDPSDLDATLDKGLWGGLIVLGNATIARPGGEDGIEGIDADEVRAKYGGSDDTQNSGVLRYVSIRHGGAALSEGNEINGLSLGGVGSGTTIEHIEVLSNFDDGIEFFGGSVSVRYASVAFCGDDGFDYDYGWSGNGQYWFYLADDEGSVGRGGEHDGANPDLEEPFSRPTIFNATYIGSGAEASGLDGDENDRALEFRDRAGGFYHNSIFTDFPGGGIRIEDLENDDMDTYANFQNSDLVLSNNIFGTFDNGTTLESLVDGENAADIASTLATNGNIVEDPVIAGINRDPVNQLDPRPNAGPARTAGDDPTNEFIEATWYKGAFDPEGPLWLKNWTALDEYGYLGDIVTNTNRIEDSGFEFFGIAPMPAKDMVTVQFTMPTAAQVDLVVYDLTGRKLQTILSNETRAEGEHFVTFDVQQLPNGQYFMVLAADGVQLTQKMVVAK